MNWTLFWAALGALAGWTVIVGAIFRLVISSVVTNKMTEYENRLESVLTATADKWQAALSRTSEKFETQLEKEYARADVVSLQLELIKRDQVSTIKELQAGQAQLGIQIDSLHEYTHKSVHDIRNIVQKVAELPGEIHEITEELHGIKRLLAPANREGC